MSEEIEASSSTVEQEQAAFMGRIVEDLYGVMKTFTMYIGLRLGLYRAIAEGGPSTSAELASRAGTQERYTREWLEQQVVAGVLTVDDETLGSFQRRYHLAPERAEVLLNRENPNYLGALPIVITGAVKPIEAVLEAFRSGGGVPFSAYGRDIREGQAEINRWIFLYQLAQEWLPVMADLHVRLQADPPARVADFGCGYGWSSIGMAKGYPRIIVDGFDLDEPSVVRARDNALECHVADRVLFHTRDAGDPALAGQYDLVTAFECVHDMSDPVSALRSMRRLLAEGGTVLIMDERTGDRFGAENFAAEGILYGSSVLHCLPVGMVGEGARGTGALIRPDILRGYVLEAGFREMETLPIDNPSYHFYRLIK